MSTVRSWPPRSPALSPSALGASSAREAASLVGLWLRLWGRREGLDDARQAVRQGVYLGGVLLAMVVSAEAWSSVGLDRLGVTGPVALAAAAMWSVAAVLAAGGWRTAALAAAVVSILAVTVSSGEPPAAGILAAVALLAGDRFGARGCWRGSLAGAVAAGLLAAVATHVPAEAVGGGSLVVLGGLPVALLAVGWFDPRFAVAATTAWLGAFVTVDAVTSSARATTSLVVCARGTGRRPGQLDGVAAELHASDPGSSQLVISSVYC